MQVQQKIFVNRSSMKSGKNTISVVKNGGGPVYASVIVSCYDMSSSFKPGEWRVQCCKGSINKVDAKTTDEGIEIHPQESSSFKTGDLILVEIQSSKNEGTGDYLMVEDAIPSGIFCSQT